MNGKMMHEISSHHIVSICKSKIYLCIPIQFFECQYNFQGSVHPNDPIVMTCDYEYILG